MILETGTVDELKESLLEMWVWQVPGCGHRIVAGVNPFGELFEKIYGVFQCPVCYRKSHEYDPRTCDPPPAKGIYLGVPVHLDISLWSQLGSLPKLPDGCGDVGTPDKNLSTMRFRVYDASPSGIYNPGHKV